MNQRDAIGDIRRMRRDIHFMRELTFGALRISLIDDIRVYLG